MTRSLNGLLLFVLFQWLPAAGANGAGGLTEIPKYERPVTDQAKVLSPGAVAALEARLLAFKAETRHQIAVFTVPSLGGEAIEALGLRVGHAWGLGTKENDDGVLVLLAPNDRKVRIEVGYGLEGAIPDARAKQVAADLMAPKLKAGDVDGAVKAGVERLMELARAESNAPTTTPAPPGKEPEVGRPKALFPILGTLGFVLVIAFVSWREKRKKGASLGSSGANWRDESSASTWLAANSRSRSSSSSDSSSSSSSSSSSDDKGGGGDFGGGGASSDY